MSLKPIRQYFKDRFFALDQDYEEHDDAFNTENIGELSLDKAYHIFYGSLNNLSVDQATSKDNVDITVSIFTKTSRDPVAEIDNAMDFANTFRMNCIHPRFLANQQFIKFIKCNSITAEALTGNDNAIVVRLRFSCIVIFGLGVNLTTDC